MVIWSKKFATGSLTLDQQHRVLIDHINALEEHLHATQPTPEAMECLINLVDYITDYADVHFKVEEQCMDRFRCPAHAENQQAHEQFQEVIGKFRREFDRRGLKGDLLKTLHEFMERWIQGHILKIDSQLQPCMRASSRPGSES